MRAAAPAEVFHAAAVMEADQHPGQLAHGGGLARPVHPDHHHNGRVALSGGQVQAPVEVRLHKFQEFGAQHLTGTFGVRHTVDAQFPTQCLGEFRGGSDSQVGGDQGGLEVVPGLGIDPVDAQQLAEGPLSFWTVPWI